MKSVEDFVNDGLMMDVIVNDNVDNDVIEGNVENDQSSSLWIMTSF